MNKYELWIRLCKDGKVVKHYMANNLSFPNLVSTGDTIIMGGNSIDGNLLSEPVKVYHSLPENTSVIEAHVNIFDRKLSAIEKIIAKYNPHEIRE